MTFTFLLLGFLILASGMFSAGETALFSLSAHQRQLFERAKPGPKRLAATLIHRPDQLLVTVLLGNMAVNVAFFAISSVLVIQLKDRVGGGWATLLAFLPLITLILLGEVLPKAVAVTHPVSISMLVAFPLFVVNRALAPVRGALQWLFIKPAVRLLSPDAPETDPGVTHEELQTLLASSAHRGLIDRPTSLLLQEVVELHDVKVREVMVHRADIIAFDLDEGLDELIRLVRLHRLKQVPVFRQDIDHLCGVINVKELFLYQGRTLDQLVRPVLYVPELATVDRLLSTFRERGEKLAIAVDEYGGTAGLVTLRDVAERIIGELHQPADTLGEPIRQLAEDEYLIAGQLSIRDWADLFAPRIELRGVDTVAGLMAARLGRVPALGDSVRVRNLLLTVQEMDRRRVTWIRLRRVPPAESALAGTNTPAASEPATE